MASSRFGVAGRDNVVAGVTMSDFANIIVAWADGSEEQFEAAVPLRFLSEHYRSRGWKGTFDVLFISGFDRLSASYVAQLRDNDFLVHDVSGSYRDIEREFAGLARFGTYAKRCFLRWAAISRFVRGPFIHHDGDIVLNESPAIVEERARGLTFVTQGCPAFTVVSDPEWLETYLSHLRLFADDVEGYSQEAWLERENWEITFRTNWAGSRFHEIIGHDQDLISHLLHTGRMPQAEVRNILEAFSDYFICENPIVMHGYVDNFPLRYSREKGIDHFSFQVVEDTAPVKKRVLFWHFQNSFNLYAAQQMLRERLGVGHLPGRMRLNMQHPTLEERINRSLGARWGHTRRASVYEHFLRKTDFSGLFTDQRWWKKGLFA